MKKMSDEKKVIHEGIVYRFSSDWIHKLETEEHWRLYWRQQNLMQDRIQGGNSILEIGVGSGFTANYLRTKGFLVTTVDIDAEKKPDIVANIVTFDPKQVFDHILAFEVFEHFPFVKFVQVVEKLSEYCRKYLFMSIPQYKRVLASIECRFPKLGRWAFTLTIPRTKLIEHHHYWELGYQGINDRKIVNILSNHGFRLEHSDEVFCRRFFAFRRIKPL
jgi:2-polyprenyl-3-methyl-5-hydroxy-6-metoxy-1,4-benzoquinol methylase